MGERGGILTHSGLTGGGWWGFIHGQGGAADVVMMAMLKIHSSPKLKELGWKLLLQVRPPPPSLRPPLPRMTTWPPPLIGCVYGGPPRVSCQIHDEVIVEGPDESVEEALAEVKACMERPWDGLGLEPLLVKLEVDAKSAKSWYEAK